MIYLNYICTIRHVKKINIYIYSTIAQWSRSQTARLALTLNTSYEVADIIIVDYSHSLNICHVKITALTLELVNG